MEIVDRVNNAIVKAKKNGIGVNCLLVGDKEAKEIEQLPDEFEKDDTFVYGPNWNITVYKVDKPEFFMTGYEE